MVDDIHTHHPTATEVVGRSWLYSVANYRACFPDKYVYALSRLVPPGFEGLFPGSVGHLSFHGTSMWDQFQTRYGWIPEHTARQFQVAIEQSSDTTGLLNAFPYLPFQAKAPITAFYDWDPQQLPTPKTTRAK